MLSQGLIGPRDADSSRAALPTGYSTTRQQTGHPFRAVRAPTDEALRSMSTQLELVLDDGWPVEPTGVAPRIAVRGALQGSQRTAADGGTGLQPVFRWFVGLYKDDRLPPDDVGGLRVGEEPLR